LVDLARGASIAMRILAKILWQRGDYSEAEQLCRDALTLREDKLGHDDIDTLTSCSDLSDILWDQAKYDTAEEMGK
jgi:hypothetical protein